MSIMDLLIPALGLGAGYVIKQNAEKKAERKRNAVLNNMQAINTAGQKKNVASVVDTMQMVRPEIREPAYEQAAQQNVQRLTEDVTAPPEIPLGPQYGGKIGEAFSTATAKRTASDLDYSTRLARLMGRAAAPADLALSEHFQNVDGSLDREQNNLMTRHGLNNEQLKLNAIEPNGGQMLAGDLLQMGGIQAGMPKNQDYLSVLQQAFYNNGLDARGERPQPGSTNYVRPPK